jgi:hypothetical protein
VTLRVFSTAYGLFAVLAITQACNSSFQFDVPPPVVTAGTAGAPVTAGVAGALPQAGMVSAAGVSSNGGSGGGGVSASGGTDAGSGGAAGTSAGAAGTSVNNDSCGAVAACPAPLHCAGDVCVQCAADADCERYDLARCDPTRHRCVACIGTADCESGFVCDELANHCLRQCNLDADCPAPADGCDGLRRVCYQCDEDEECLRSPLGHVCATDRSGCVHCRKDLDCQGQLCDQLTGRCVDCRDSGDCSSGLCDPMTGSCINP